MNQQRRLPENWLFIYLFIFIYLPKVAFVLLLRRRALHLIVRDGPELMWMLIIKFIKVTFFVFL
jgi:hypothetical protein